MTAPVLAGIDGSPLSLQAARHAAVAARRRGAPLQLLYAWAQPYIPGPDVSGLMPLGLEETAGRVAEEEAEKLRREYPDLKIDVRVEPGTGARCLIQASADAQLTVVGSRGHGGFTELLLGSVATQVAGHAHGEVLVVRGDRPPDSTGPVVVGADGSPASHPAVRAAAAEAHSRRVPLEVLFAWWVDAFAFPVTATYEDVERGALAAAEKVVAEAVAEAERAAPGVSVKPRLERSLNPEHSLVESSADASLVVVGSRGRGGFRGLLLGSVSQALVHHAACPVLIAHHD